MSFVLTKGTDDENATEFAYVTSAYACVAIVKTRLNSIDGVRHGSSTTFEAGLLI